MPYVSVAIEGGLFPPDLLDRIAAGDASLSGQKASDFGLNGTRRLTDEIQSAFSDARSYWDAFQRRLERSHESRTTITREDWVAKFMELLGFEKLVVQRSSAEAGNERYFISHRAGDFPDAPPIHIVSIEQSLDHRDGTGRRSPHGLVQEYLNRSDALWGMVTNGKQLRLLRNIARLSKPTYLEFNLEGMMVGNLYSEFVLLYRLLHISRLPKEGADAHECLLERYYQQGIDEGGRVREKLRDGVEEALGILGTALLTHPRSGQLRHKFESKALNAPGYYRQLLRLVYRLLFLMVAEERKLIFPLEESATGLQFIYTRYYGVARLRDRADRYFAGDSNIDLWLGLCQTFRILRDNEAAKELGLSALNGELFSHVSCPDLEEAACTNDSLLKALRELSTFRDESGVRRRVNYAGLDVEEFGSVYESLLDFHPQVTLQPPQFDLVAGSERKQTGSYYTPPELVHELVESALVPVMQDRLRSLKTRDEQEAALLSLRVCDPASGSGHFLLAAGRRIARELATVRSNGLEPSPEEYRRALRDVIRTCVYAVDKNPLAVDLCKVALWIEGHSAGLPLSFLDHHIKCGDSLVGMADLKALDQGIPDEAYQPVIGDDKQAATYYKKRNQEERKRERQLYMGESRPIAQITDSLADDFEVLGTLEERTPDEVNAKEGLYNSLRRQDSDWWKLKVACDLWTAAFFMPLKQEDALHMEGAPTTGTIRRHLETNSAHPVLIGQAVATSEEHRFFHWELEFPDVFERGGFDVVLGNPPWDRLQFEEQDFFVHKNPSIFEEHNQARRRRMIFALESEDQDLFHAWSEARRYVESEGKFMRNSARFALSAVDRFNLYSVFTELALSLYRDGGRAGLVVKAGFITDEICAKLFSSIFMSHKLVSVAEFENRYKIFPDVHPQERFAVVTLGNKVISADFSFDNLDMRQLRQSDRHIEMSFDDIVLLSPNTRNCPKFPSVREFEISKKCYKVGIPLVQYEPPRNEWQVSVDRYINVSDFSDEIVTSRELAEGEASTDVMPIYEGKMFHQYDHRYATYDEYGAQVREVVNKSPDTAIAFYRHIKRISAIRRNPRLEELSGLLGIRDITNRTNERGVIAAILPPLITDYTIRVVQIEGESSNKMVLLALFNSFVFDYLARQRLGGTHLSNYVLEQTPVLAPTTFSKPCGWFTTATLKNWILRRAFELTYTAWDLQSFAEDLSYSGPPFRWDEERRFLLRCELDAAFFHLYGMDRDDVDYIMDTFPIVKRKDEERYGEYRTKSVILEIYDDMLKAMRTGEPYQTRLDLPPADPRIAHPPQGR
ncbi:MAG: N-6 DNA methylase [Desulfobacterales bacterium]|nr:N-6 DNA methylase [Desulfobacterales bacterium]